MVDSLYLYSHTEQEGHMVISGSTEIASCN